MGLFFQSRLNDVYKTDKIVPVVIESAERVAEISEFYSKYDDMMSALVFNAQQSTKFGLTIPDGSKVMVFFMRECIDVFTKMLKIFNSATALRLVENIEITERPTTNGVDPWTKKDNKYLFSMEPPNQPRTIADTVLFINDVLINGDVHEFNPMHAWSHLRVLWQYRKASAENRLAQWKTDQLKTVTNIFSDPLFEGSLFYLLLFAYDNPPS
jgi:hypothetical protein